MNRVKFNALCRAFCFIRPPGKPVVLTSGDMVRIIMALDNRIESVAKSIKAVPIKALIEYHNRLVWTRNKVRDARNA